MTKTAVPSGRLAPPALLRLVLLYLALATAGSQSSSAVGYADSFSITGTAAVDYNIGVLYPGSTLSVSSCTEDVSTTYPAWDGFTAPYSDCGTTLDFVNVSSGKLLSPLVVTRQTQVVASTCGGFAADVSCTILGSSDTCMPRTAGACLTAWARRQSGKTLFRRCSRGSSSWQSWSGCSSRATGIGWRCGEARHSARGACALTCVVCASTKKEHLDYLSLQAQLFGATLYTYRQQVALFLDSQRRLADD